MVGISIDLAKPHDVILPKMVAHGRYEKVIANTLNENEFGSKAKFNQPIF
jgi:hypothetical protein